MDDASTLLFQRELERALSVMRVVGCDTQRFEIKKSAHGLPKDIARTLSAFSNGSGGYIVLGVSEEDGFIPVEGFDYERMQDALANVCHTKLTPPVRPEIRPFELDGSLVLGAEKSRKCIPKTNLAISPHLPNTTDPTSERGTETENSLLMKWTVFLMSTFSRAMIKSWLKMLL